MTRVLFKVCGFVVINCRGTTKTSSVISVKTMNLTVL